MADQKGMKGLGKMGSGFESKPKPGGEEHQSGGEGGDSSKTVIEHHPDGSHSVDGEHHPDHLHAGAAVLHKMSGGDKHHIVHHDGMSAHSHSIHEDGTHEDHGEHNSPEEAHGALDKFMGDEQGPPEAQHEDMGQEQHEPAYGAM